MILFEYLLFQLTLRIHPTDPLLDLYLRTGLVYGIKSINTVSDHFIKIEFKNGIEATLWNANKHYAWLSEGTIVLPNGMAKDYKYSGAMPSRSTMFRLRRSIKNKLS